MAGVDERAREGLPTVDLDGPPPTACPLLAAGTVLGRYLVTGVLGEGGAGVVYAAYDPELDRKLAIKLVQPLARTQARLLHEAQAMARVSHPNVVVVHDVGTFGDRVFVAMELVDGGTLRDWLRAGRRSWREVLDVVVAAGRGLAAAHEAGFVHLDFKPENVLIARDGRVRVTDFGLVRAGPEARGNGRVARGAGRADRATRREAPRAVGAPGWRSSRRWPSWRSRGACTRRARRSNSSASARLRELRSLAEVMTSADGGVVDAAVQAAGRLSPVAACADLAALTAPVAPPADAAARAGVEALRVRLADARARASAGKIADAIVADGARLEEARRTGYAPLVAEVLLELGAAHDDAGNYDDAARALREAIEVAEEARHDAVRGEALVRLAEVTGRWQAHYDQAAEYADSAVHVARRTGDARLESFALEQASREHTSRTSTARWTRRAGAWPSPSASSAPTTCGAPPCATRSPCRSSTWRASTRPSRMTVWRSTSLSGRWGPRTRRSGASSAIWRSTSCGPGALPRRCPWSSARRPSPSRRSGPPAPATPTR